MSIKHNIDATIAELVRLRESVSDKHDEKNSEYKAMHRRIGEQRRELARLNAGWPAARDAARDAQRYKDKAKRDAIKQAKLTTAQASTNIATAWRELALERMRPDETEQGLKIRAMHRAIEIGNPR